MRAAGAALGASGTRRRESSGRRRRDCRGRSAAHDGPTETVLSIIFTRHSDTDRRATEEKICKSYTKPEITKRQSSSRNSSMPLHVFINMTQNHVTTMKLLQIFQQSNIGSRPSDHYFRSVCLFVCLFVQSFSQPSFIRFRLSLIHI